MRRMLLCALLVGLCLFTACGQQQTAETDESSDLMVIGFTQVGAESDWRVAHTESIRSTFSEENGYELIYSDAQQKQENQITAIRRFILQNVDYILLAPTKETGWDSVLLEAKEAGIPVILVDRMIEVSDDSLYTAFVGSDFYAEGQAALEWLDQTLEEQGRGADPIKILHVMGTLDSTPQVGRTEALTEALETHDNWTLTAALESDFTRAKGYESMQQYLASEDADLDFDVIYCENDTSAMGVLQALEEAGYDTDSEELTVIAFDATNSGLTACLNGAIDLDVECDPLQGPLIETVIQQLEAGETPEKNTYTEIAWFDTAHLTQSVIDGRPY